MSTRRTSFGKVERERAKKTKAAAKREQRQIRSSGEGVVDEEQPVPEMEAAGESTAELLARIEQLHQRFDAGVLDYEDFETQKSDLLGRLRLD